MRKWSRLQPYLDVHGVLSLYFQMEQLYKKSRSPFYRGAAWGILYVTSKIVVQHLKELHSTGAAVQRVARQLLHTGRIGAPGSLCSPADGALNGCPVIAVLFGNRFIDFFLDGLQPVLLFLDKPQAVGNDGVRTHTADDAQWPERLSNTQRERGRISDGHF